MKLLSYRARMIMAAVTVVLVLTLIILLTPTVDGNKIVSATITADVYGDKTQKALSKQEIADVVSVINSKKRSTKSYSVGGGDCLFSIEMVMTDKSIQTYDISLGPDKNILIVQRSPSKSLPDKSLHDGSRDKAWYMNISETDKAFNMPAFEKFYASSNPVFPVVYAEGQNIIGSYDSDHWEYKNFSEKWNQVTFSPTNQEKIHQLAGYELNILFPCFPKQKKYAIYDVNGSKIESGDFSTPRLALPQKEGTYKIELTGQWDYQENCYPRDAGREGVPNSFRGNTTSTFLVHCGPNASDTAIPMDTSEHLLLISVEQGLKELNATFNVDYNSSLCTIQSIDKQTPKTVAVIDARITDVDQVKTFNLEVESTKIKRNFYIIKDIAYMEAHSLAYDLGMVLKDNNDGTYLYSENQTMYPVTIPDTYRNGYINHSGQWIIPPVLAYADDFEDGYARFSIKDTPVSAEAVQGNISGAQFQQFSNDLQSSLIDFYTPELTGIIDQQGNVVLPPLYKDLYYRGGEAVVLPDEGEYGEIVVFLFSERQKVVLKGFDVIMNVGLYSEGLIPLSLREEGNYDDYYAYIDIAGKIVIDRQFKVAESFVNGKAVVGMGPYNSWDHCKQGVIDKQGNFKVPYLFNKITNYSENVACVCLITNDVPQYAYIDTEGNLLTDLKYTIATNFSSGRAVVNLDNDSLTYIDKSFQPVKTPDGKAIIAYKRNGGYPFWAEDSSFSPFSEYMFSEGYALSEEDGKYGFIDTMGNLVINHQFKSVQPFKNGMAKVELKEDKYKEQETYVDTLGRIIEIEPLETEAKE